MFGKKQRKKSDKRVKYDRTPLGTRAVRLAILSAVLTIAVELLNRALVPARLWTFITTRPLDMLYNYLLVLTTLSFSELFKRRRAVLASISILWPVLGIVQYIVVKQRTQPFCSVDILMLKDAFSLITIYMTWPEIIAIFGSGFLVIALVVALFAQLPVRKQYSFPRALVGFAGMTLLCVMFSALGVSSEYFPRRYENMVECYNLHGFPHCFIATFGQQGISRPQEYSTETVAEIIKDIDGDERLAYPEFDESDNLTHPNIVFLQMESFFDVTDIIGSEYSEDPMPNFHRLCKYFPSGTLYVPTIGGGTANTEFEVLTGLNIDFFGAGEYPYNTILHQTAVETVNTDLREYGYTSTAMHDHEATFYGRNVVYPNLGFDRFVSLEYMIEPEYTPLGWAKDGVMVNELVKTLKATDARDVVTVVTVESHGKYAEEYEPKEGDVGVLKLPEQIPYGAFCNFVNVLPATDDFLKEVIYALARFEEPTILVAYGDHLPAMELESEMLTSGSIYASKYVVWNNFGATLDAPDIEAYRLGAQIMQQLGFTGGVISRFHQANDPSEKGTEYLDKLELLQYDMLYGDKEAFEGESPYEPTDMAMGVVPITVTGIENAYHRLLVTGENFTEFSTVCLGDTALETLYIDPEHIIAPLEDGTAPDDLKISQVAKDGTVLSTSR